MLSRLTHFALAQAADGAAGWHFTKNPQLPVWLLVLFCLICGGLAIYLYRAQRKVTSTPIIVTLTTLRTLLILLMFLVLLGPGCQYTRTGTANGTLWLVVDQSQSMEQADPQATPVEKIRWADALGYLSAGRRPSHLDRQAARLSALRSDLVHWNAASGVPAGEGDAGKRLEQIVAGLKKWNSQLKSVVESIEKDPLGKNDPETLKSLKSLADSMNAGIAKVEGQGKLDRLSADVPWRDAAATVDGAVTKLSAAADKSDQALWDKNEPAVKEAVDKVSKLNRAQLARLVLTREANKANGDNGETTDAEDSGSFEHLLPKQSLKLVGFGDGAQVILPERGEPSKAIVSALSSTPAPATDLGAALRAVADNVAQDEPASVVIVSDGRHNKRERDPADVADAARRLRARGVRVYSLLLGSGQVAPDAAVEQIDSPDWVFKGDTMKLSALLRLDALGGKTVTAELYRLQHQGGQVKETLVDAEEVEVPRPGPAGTTAYRKVVSFLEKKGDLPEPGLYDYEVRIREVPDEAIKVNNRQAVRVSVKEDKLNILMIDNQPRYEFRYLKNYLARDNRVRVQAMLLQPARIAMGADPSKRVEPPPPRKPSTEEADTRDDFQILPEAQEEWYPWKVIVLGDVPPESLPKKQQEMIVKAVTDGGATLVLLSGPLNMPNSWGTNRAEQPLAELFPCEPSPDWTPQALQAHLRQGYRPAAATAAQDHLLNQFGIDEQDNAKMWAQVHAGLGDPLHEQNWYWHSDLTLARGGANVIWWIKDNATTPTAPATRPGARLETPAALQAEQRRALLATMNVGLGKVMYFAGDHTWKLRNVNGRNLHERFWGQVIRWVVGDELPAGGQFVRFGSDQPRYVAGEAATVTARVTDRKFAPQKGLKFKVLARSVSGAGSDPKAPARVEAEMVEVPEAPGQYRARLGNLPNGQVELSLVGPEVQQLLTDDPKALQKTLAVEVQSGLNLEQRNINADRNALHAIATAGGGVAVDGAHANVLGDYIPELNYKTTSAEQIALFADARDPGTRRTHWAFLGIFVALVTAEWVIRKIGGLV